MIGVCFLILCILITIGFGIITKDINQLSKEIDEIKEKLEQHRIKLENLDFYDLSEHERRLDQLEDELECMAYYKVKKMLKQ